MAIDKDLAVLTAEVVKARAELDEATEEERAASSRQIAALNKYNNACKVFDEAVEKLRSEAPHGTDWKRP